MPSITVKGIPASLHRKLKELARRERRSLNAEILYRLERAAAESEELQPDQYLAAVRSARRRFSALDLGAKTIDEFKRRGRP